MRLTKPIWLMRSRGLIWNFRWLGLESESESESGFGYGCMTIKCMCVNENVCICVCAPKRFPLSSQILASHRVRCGDLVAHCQAAGLVVAESWVLPDNTVGVELGLARVSLQDLYACLSSLQDFQGLVQIQSMTLMLAQTENTQVCALPPSTQTRWGNAEGLLKALWHPWAQLQGWTRTWVSLIKWQVWSLLLLALGAVLLWAATTMAPFVNAKAGTVSVPALGPVLEVAFRALVNAIGK